MWSRRRSRPEMLQGRFFSYGDAVRYRLCVNTHQIPVNVPRCVVHSYHRDGAMRVDRAGCPPSCPTAAASGPTARGWRSRRLVLSGAVAHWDHRADEDYYSQSGTLFRLMSPEQKLQLFDNTARSRGGASEDVQQRHIRNCTMADSAYGAGVAEALKNR